jgi:UDP-4-amino-4,6-dideoxy-N-acetyl-beta-L-altrosamine N-acetyltransferase
MNHKKPYTLLNFTCLDTEEIELVWRWRNHESIRKWMYNDAEIPFEHHLNFIQSLHNVANKRYYLIKKSDTPMGVFSILVTETHGGELGFYLAPEYHNKRLSVEIFYQVLKYLFDIHHFEKIFGYIRSDNKAIKSLTEKFNFRLRKEIKVVNGKSLEYFYIELSRKNWINVVRLIPKRAERAVQK